jgi:hypothetical protein
LSFIFSLLPSSVEFLPLFIISLRAHITPFFRRNLLIFLHLYHSNHYQFQVQSASIPSFSLFPFLTVCNVTIIHSFDLKRHIHLSISGNWNFARWHHTCAITSSHTIFL